MKILKGLASFYADIIGVTEWPSANNKNLVMLFLLKLYLSNSYLKINYIEEYLEILANEILLLGTNMDIETNEEAENLLSSIKLSDLTPTMNYKKTFIAQRPNPLDLATGHLALQ